MKTHRASVYVDGFNFYYSAILEGRKNLPRQHRTRDFPGLKVLCENILQKLSSPENPNSPFYDGRKAKYRGEHKLNAVHYFTAHVRDAEKRRRQKAYINALETTGVKIHHGEIVRGRDGNHEEKRTDVNLAAHMLNDAWLDKYDHAVIISHDRDFIEAVNLVKKRGKLVGVWLVNYRDGAKLRKKADYSYIITRDDLAKAPQIANKPKARR